MSPFFSPDPTPTGSRASTRNCRADSCTLTSVSRKAEKKIGTRKSTRRASPCSCLLRLTRPPCAHPVDSQQRQALVRASGRPEREREHVHGAHLLAPRSCSPQHGRRATEQGHGEERTGLSQQALHVSGPHGLWRYDEDRGGWERSFMFSCGGDSLVGRASPRIALWMDLGSSGICWR